MLDDNAVLSAPTVFTLGGRSGLIAEVLDSGALRRLEAFGTSLLLHPATVAEAGLTNVHLRLHRPEGIRRLALLGPGSGSVVTGGDGEVAVTGSHESVAYRLSLRLGEGQADAATWHWDVELTNTSGEPVTADVVLTHDPALAPLANVRINEYYVSQYLDITPVATSQHGTAVAVRQNMPGERAPWLMVGTVGTGAGWSTDALQVVERTERGVVWSGLDAAELPSRRLQHEHSLIALQDAPVEIAPTHTHRTGFWGITLEDHPAATSDDDARWADVALAASPTEAVQTGGGATGRPTPSTLWSSGAAFASRALTREELDAAGLLADRRHVETSDDGTELAWVVDGGQLVTPAKELAVLRPHGHLLRTGDTFTPDSHSLASTVWMAGTFHSQVTRGHVGRNALATGRRTYLGLQRAHGVRLFIEAPDDTWHLLETPSAWFTGLDHCTWWYAAASGPLLTVTSSAPADEHTLRLSVRQQGAAPRRVLLAMQVADDLTPAPSVTTAGDHVHITTAHDPRPWRVSWAGPGSPDLGDARLQVDGVSRGHGWLTVLFEPAEQVEVVMASAPGAGDAAEGEVSPTDEHLGAAFWHKAAHAVSLDGAGLGDVPEAQAHHLSAALPWFAHNALVHYLSPRGLEQFSGGAWGTRDVCQGPVGLLTALGRQDAVRDVLLRVFRAQNARGDWPQAFEFLPPLRESGQPDSHGDVVFWPVLATGDYLRTTRDAGLLEETVAFVGDDALGEPATVAAHLRRAVDRITECTVPGSPLPAYGHGDWNDSLQPADPRLAAHLVSTWTAVLQTQSLRTLAEGLRAAGAPGDAGALADDADDLAERTHDALLDQLAADPVLPGYLLHHDEGRLEPLVHPTDERTGLRYGVLPWIHAIGADLLTPEQARHHLDLIEEHLLGPDGARLFDRPVSYVGGPMTVFQRAEASTFWGREIGLMYMHAHLRYAEALARVGDGAGLLRALAKSSPVGLESLVPQARPRQTTCYYSSSDGAFTDRYDAQARYAALMAGEVPLEGGWRVYSSGPGLVLRLVTEVLLGIRQRGDDIEIDPVLPPGEGATAGELTARLPLLGHDLTVRYFVGPEGHGVRRVTVAGRELDLRPLRNPYRRAGAVVRAADLTSGPSTTAPTTEIHVETH
ncbi:cellobiose phosphorylase [Terrabacter sp. MAHUQ-38]|uniref:cellobiose phosphorylase n=1 Tax=unclassified Terrabacter TaxID=2630222 RepID=UPI00165DDC57|nr:cellobiose phosphorylase [Terrabacter sp. MAHUQ-38]MBC9820226.1 cellobiose phosphorylase [Terrabacter sp. MAHUQ-38]